jgi:hypothetical protein
MLFVKGRPATTKRERFRGVPDEWYIKSQVSTPVTGLSPAKLIKYRSSEEEFVENKIKIFNGKEEPVSLTDATSSLMKYLQNTQL